MGEGEKAATTKWMYYLGVIVFIYALIRIPRSGSWVGLPAAQTVFLQLCLTLHKTACSITVLIKHNLLRLCGNRHFFLLSQSCRLPGRVQRSTRGRLRSRCRRSSSRCRSRGGRSSRSGGKVSSSPSRSVAPTSSALARQGGSGGDSTIASFGGSRFAPALIGWSELAHPLLGLFSLSGLDDMLGVLAKLLLPDSGDQQDYTNDSREIRPALTPVEPADLVCSSSPRLCARQRRRHRRPGPSRDRSPNRP
mgnify:CR=1 FL=1|jgi:hypothetical protein